jgi:hypothetical protein
LGEEGMKKRAKKIKRERDRTISNALSIYTFKSSKRWEL